MVENGRKKVHRDYLVGNGFPRVSRRGHRGRKRRSGKNGGKWQKMVETKFTAIIW